MYRQDSWTERGIEGNVKFNSARNVQELDVFIHQLRNPPSTAKLMDQLLYLCHYVPYMKNEANLALVISSFLQSPLDGSVSVLSQCMVLDAFASITTTKLKVSNPTLSVDAFYSVMLDTVTSVAERDLTRLGPKSLPIIAGLMSCNDLRDEIYTSPQWLTRKPWAFMWDRKAREAIKRYLFFTLSRSQLIDAIYSSIICLAAAYNEGLSISEYIPPGLSSLLIESIVSMLFLQTECSLFHYRHFLKESPSHPLNPIARHYALLSLILAASYKGLPMNSDSYRLVSAGLDSMKRFNRKLAADFELSRFNDIRSVHRESDGEFWNFLKILVFSQVIILEGIMSGTISSRTDGNWFRQTQVANGPKLSSEVLACVINLNFAVRAFGMAGFDTFQFVFLSAVDTTLQEPRLLEDTSTTLLNLECSGHLSPSEMNLNYALRSKVIFAFEMWEHYLQQPAPKDELFVVNHVYPLCMSLVQDPRYTEQDVFEAAHSVILLCLSQIPNFTVRDHMSYMSLLFAQFPLRLSVSQLEIATYAVGKTALIRLISYQDSMHTDSADEFFRFLMFNVSHIRSGIMLTPKVSTGAIPSTVREAMVACVIDLMPFFPVDRFQLSLRTLWRLVEESSKSEMNFLQERMWKVLSTDLDMNRSNLGYLWWYKKLEQHAFSGLGRL